MMFQKINALKSGEWSESELQFLRDNYKDLRSKTMAEYLQRPLHSVEARLRELRKAGEVDYRDANRRKDVERHEAEILQGLTNDESN
jgi:hypothetical protein